MRWCMTLAIVATLTPAAHAQVQLAGQFGDHMVLQRALPLPLWGTAAPGEKVQVTFQGHTAETTASPEGQWRLSLPPLSPQTEASELRVTGNQNRVVIGDVLVGDVWVVSGQSNMQFSLKASKEGAEELAKADRPLLRLCIVGQKAAKLPLSERELTWKVCTAESARGFSAVGYGLGKELQEAEGVPVGVVQAAVSGTPAQSWTSVEAMRHEAVLARYVEQYDAMKGAEDPSNAGAAKPGTPGSLYNGMIAPLTGMAIQGVAWYQGESNTGDADVYATLFGTMIGDWRKAWGRDVPFVWVQLPGNQKRAEAPEESKWAQLREAQAETLKLPRTGMAVTVDLAGASTILHPQNKREVGRRLALEARRVAYGEAVAVSPRFEKMTVEGETVRVRFGETKELVVGAPKAWDPLMPSGKGLPAKGFAVAGEDRKWVWAEGKVEGAEVVVWSGEVKKPVAVRYGWANNPEVNLYGTEGLPAGPFRTDRW